MGAKKLEFKSLPFEIKTAEDDGKTGIIEGYAAVFGNKDFTGDIIHPTAFIKTMQEGGVKWPILDGHDPSKQIGYNLEAREDAHGLWVKGEINLETSGGRERYALAKQAKRIGAKAGLSIGFRTIKAEPDHDDPFTRHIHEIKMYEYSPVTFPANELAQVTQIKSLWDAMEGLEVKEVVDRFIDSVLERGISREELHKALADSLSAAEGAKKDPSLDEIAQSLRETTEFFRAR